MAITETETTTHPASEPPSSSRSRRPAWLFPSDQPGWARPGLIAVAALAALIFTWGAFHTAVNNFYAADARSMSMSWKNFLYGSFDPAGSITIDKLWGFLWPQALSVKIFGYHAWALALPEAIEGVISVLVLYRLARRWTGRSDVALLSAGLFTLTPIVAATFGHSGLEDNALTMCLILATDAFQRAVNQGRLRSLALCGFWVGMAFQTKMVQAWTVVPVFALVYLICAPHPLLKRVWHTAVFGAVTTVASLWLMVIVTLTPAADRPFIDGSNGTNSIFNMVFVYNFTSRFGSLSSSSGGSSGGGVPGTSDWGKLFEASFGSQIGWLYPVAVIALVFGLIKTWRARRSDGVRAGYLMWGGTLGITALAFSAGTIPHSQYMTVLAPGLAALSAAGIVGLFRAFRDDERTGWLLIVAITCTVAWATKLSYENTVFLSWLPPLVIALGLASILLLLAYRVRRVGKLLAVGVVLGTTAMVATPAAWALSTFDTSAGYNGTNINAAAGPYSGQFGVSGTTGGRSGGAPGGSGHGFGGGTGGGPGGSSSSSGTKGGFPGGSSGSSGTSGGPGSSSSSGSSSTSGAPSGGFPGSSSSSSSGSSSSKSGAPSGTTGGGGGSMPGGSGTSLTTAEQDLLTYLKAHQDGATYLMAVMSSGDAEDYVANAGASVLPIGGFSGADGYPSLAAFKTLVEKGELKYVLLSSSGSGGGGMGGSSSSSTSAIEAWVKANFTAVTSSAYGGSSSGTLYVYSGSS
jgi:4-amino-4-deoxy-L-arabinose transferase-like glycosyltransferase